MAGENELMIDAAQLEAEARAIELPDEPPAPGAPAPEPAPIDGNELTLDQAEALAASYEAAAVVLYGQAARIVCPNWNLTPAEVRELSHATAVALALWFPNQQLPPKYAALLALAGTAYTIADARRDPATGRVRPMRAPIEEGEGALVAAAPRAPGESFVMGGGPGGGFSTSA